MLRLHGFAVSNYFNMAKLALLEKGADFEINTVHSSQDAEVLAKSPRGKVPFLETEQGFISETNVILEYIEGPRAARRCLPGLPSVRVPSARRPRESNRSLSRRPGGATRAGSSGGRWNE